MTQSLRASPSASCWQSTRQTLCPRVTLQRQKSVATDTASDTASEKISKLQKFTHERLTQALLRRPLHSYAARPAATWPNEMLSHQSTGHLDAITEPLNSDSSAPANGILECRSRAMADSCVGSCLRCSSSLHNERDNLCCRNRRHGYFGRSGCASSHVHGTGWQLPTRSNSLLRCCSLNNQHASHFQRSLPGSTSRVLRQPLRLHRPTNTWLSASELHGANTGAVLLVIARRFPRHKQHCHCLLRPPDHRSPDHGTSGPDACSNALRRNTTGSQTRGLPEPFLQQTLWDWLHNVVLPRSSDLLPTCDDSEPCNRNDSDCATTLHRLRTTSPAQPIYHSIAGNKHRPRR